MTQSKLVGVNASAVDYLADELIASYFEAREHESYYRSLKLVDPRRDFHEVIIPILMNFIGEVISNPNTDVLDEVIEAAAEARLVVKPTDQIVAEAKRLHAVGFSLLEITNELSIDTLKSLYRRAARKYHPDAGGSDELMKKVNEAYNLFHELLCQSRFAVTEVPIADQTAGDLSAPIRTARDYIYVLGLLLLDIKLDDWALDDAQYWLSALCSPEWMSSKYAQHERTRWNMFYQCDRLAGLQWAAGRQDDSRQAHGYAEEILRASGGAGDWSRARSSSTEKYMEQGEKLRLVLNHRRQADNALRLGLIDEKRYAKTMERLRGKDARTERRQEVFERYRREVGFFEELPTDATARGKKKRATLVPEPAYFQDRLDTLTDDQQAEYLEAFGEGACLQLARKYALVRLTSLLRSMVVHPGVIDLVRAERECRLLASIRDDSKDDIYAQVADLAQYLSGLAPDDRRERLEILRRLDEMSADGVVITTTVNLGSGTATTTGTGSSLRVRCHSQYFGAVRAPIERLRLASRTGSLKTQEEETRDREAWNRDISLCCAGKN